MSNVLKASLQTTIYSLADRGWSQRRIASELGINRETVRRYLRLAKPAISTADSEEGADRNPAISITGKQAEHADSKPAISIAGTGAGRRSRCEWLAEVISAKLEAGLSARRIYQDLVEQNDFRDSYQSVQRFVSKLRDAAAAGLANGSSAWRGGAGGLWFGRPDLGWAEPSTAELGLSDGLELFAQSL